MKHAKSSTKQFRKNLSEEAQRQKELEDWDLENNGDLYSPVRSPIKNISKHLQGNNW